MTCMFLRECLNVFNFRTSCSMPMFEVFGSQRKEMLLQTKLDIGMGLPFNAISGSGTNLPSQFQQQAKDPTDGLYLGVQLQQPV